MYIITLKSVFVKPFLKKFLFEGFSSRWVPLRQHPPGVPGAICSRRSSPAPLPCLYLYRYICACAWCCSRAAACGGVVQCVQLNAPKMQEFTAPLTKTQKSVRKTQKGVDKNVKRRYNTLNNEKAHRDGGKPRRLEKRP